MSLPPSYCEWKKTPAKDLMYNPPFAYDINNPVDQPADLLLLKGIHNNIMSDAFDGTQGVVPGESFTQKKVLKDLEEKINSYCSNNNNINYNNLNSSQNPFVNWINTGTKPNVNQSSVSQFKIDFETTVQNNLTPIIGYTVSDKIVNMLSDKVTPKELIKMVPNIIKLLSLPKNVTKLQNNSINSSNVLDILNNIKLIKKDMYINGTWLHNVKPRWGYAVKWKNKRWGWHVHPTRLHAYSPGFQNMKNNGIQCEEHNMTLPEDIIQNAKEYFAGQLHIPVECIHHVIFPEGGRGEGATNPIGHRWRVVWERYKFQVYYYEIPQVPQVAQVQVSQVPQVQVPRQVTNPNSNICSNCNIYQHVHIWYDKYNGALWHGLCEPCHKNRYNIP